VPQLLICTGSHGGVDPGHRRRLTPGARTDSRRSPSLPHPAPSASAPPAPAHASALLLRRLLLALLTPAHTVARCSSATRRSGRPLAPAARLHGPRMRPARVLPPSARAAWAPAAQHLRAPKPSRPVPSRGRAAHDQLAPPEPAPAAAA
jgi:hypothetical protein